MSGAQVTRTWVRKNFVSLLTGFTSAGDSVFRGRAVPMFEEELVCINIYTKDDVSRLNKKFETEFPRDLQVFVEILVKKTGKEHYPEDDADVIAGQVEDRILPNYFLQFPPPENLQSGDEGDEGPKIVESIQLMQVTDDKTPEGLVDVYGLVMEFMSTYRYAIQTGSVDVFAIGNSHYNLAGEQAVADQAEDNFSIPQ